MSLSPRTSTSVIGGTYTPIPLVERMRNNWRAPSTTLQESQSPGVFEELDVVRSDPCLPITITTELTITLPYPSTIVVPHTVTYTPSCSVSGNFAIPTGSGTNKTPTNVDSSDASSSDIPASSLRDPFYASTIPMAYSIAMTITLSYVLLFLLFLSTPRPWLQKVATLTVVICLTLALAETTRILELEYSLMGETWTADTESGSAKQIRERVVAGTEMRVGRIISDTFLWLAQVQTLIRLFPRHREKIVIKWAGFALIVLDTIFSILVHFLSPTTIMSPESFLDAIPALSYLFQIVLSLLYASCVVYYSLSSRIRRFAYYHPKAPSNILIAILSLTAVLIPMIFFCLDIGQKDLAAWGDYVRWVGAAAASVVVWEWVDRIERLEREERREGVLGREIFDGDDGLVEDMGISQDDEDRGHGKGSGGESRSGGSGRGNEGEVTRSTTVSGALPDNFGSAGTVVNRHSRHSTASAMSDPSVISTVYATRRSIAGEPSSSTTTHRQLRTTSRSPSLPTEDEADANRRVTKMGIFGLSNDRQTITPSYSNTSTPVPVSNRVMSSTENGIDIIRGAEAPEIQDLTEKAENTVPSSPVTTASEEQPSRDKNGKQREVEGGTWLKNPFRRRQNSHNAAEHAASRVKWSSLKPNIPFSFPFVGALAATGLVSDSSLDKKTKDASKRQLPVTVIPAPPRGRGISLRELEEARRSGVGDENVRGVGVWTGNAMRYSSVYTSPGILTPSEPPPPQQQFSNSPGYGDSHEQSLQERLQQHQMQWTAQQHHDTAARQHQQLQRTTSFSSSALQTPPLPPLPPSPAVTATSSSWSASQYHYAQKQQQTQLYSPQRSTSPPTAFLAPSTPGTAPSVVISGALSTSSIDGASSTSPSPPPLPQTIMARQGSAGSLGGLTPKSRSMTMTASGALGVVAEAAGGSSSQMTEQAMNAEGGSASASAVQQHPKSD